MPSGAAAAPRSSLEAMLETIRRRDVQAEDAAPFLPPLPARPTCRVRPPAPGRRPRPPGFKLGSGEEEVGAAAGTSTTAPVDEKAGSVGTGGATASTVGGSAAGIVVRPAVEAVLVDVPMPRNSEPPCVRAGSSREMSETPRGRWWRCF
ncbi:unnamed protein product [Urochloa humidicola]